MLFKESPKASKERGNKKISIICAEIFCDKLNQQSLSAQGVHTEQHKSIYTYTYIFISRSLATMNIPARDMQQTQISIESLAYQKISRPSTSTIFLDRLWLFLNNEMKATFVTQRKYVNICFSNKMRTNKYPFYANTERALLATCRSFDYECCHIFLAAHFYTRTYIHTCVWHTYFIFAYRGKVVCSDV